MLPPSNTAAVVLLAGADDAAVASLQPSAEVLMEFGIAVKTMVVADHAVNATHLGGLCALIAASPDALLPAALAAATELPVIRVPTGAEGRIALGLLRDEAGELPSGGEDGPFATMAIGDAGAKNAGLFVVAMLALGDERIRAAYDDFRVNQTAAVLSHPPLE